LPGKWDLTRQRDALNTDRRNLPTVEIEKGYVFDGPGTKAEFEAVGSDFFESDQLFEMPGRSCFLPADEAVFHIYSQYARRPGILWRFLLLPRPHRFEPSRGTGDAAG
jgi:hypothetical protein